MKSQFLRILTLLIALFTCTYMLTGYAEIPANPNGKPASLAPMLKNVMSGVVNISVLGELPSLQKLLEQTPLNGQQLPPQARKKPKFRSVGSGVIINAKKGYIVTNAHVVRDAKSITVTLKDGRRFKAKKIGSDKLSDIAVLQIKPDHLAAIPFAKPNSLKVGDYVIAIGNPFGLHQTVTSGIVSALHRFIGVEGPKGYENFIQTDAPINPGNSGGALLNTDGQLVGINTAIITPLGGNIGIGFAIPSNMVHAVVQQLIKYGKVKRGVLGVMVQNLTPDLADAFNISGTKGAIVTQVSPDSPAAKAGLKPKDIIEKIDDTTVTSANMLRNATGLLPIGTRVTLKIRRDDKTMTIKATIGNPKDIKPPVYIHGLPMTGMRLADFDELAMGKHIKGVRVIHVGFTSPAWLAGVRKGDVIMDVNNEPVTNIEQFIDAAKLNQKEILLRVWRKGAVIYLVID